MIRTRRQARGFTLIELMISLVIGVSITGVGLTLYLQSTKSGRLIQSELAMQENSYYVAQTLRSFLNQAGYRPISVDLLATSRLPIYTREESFHAVSGSWSPGEIVRVLDDGFAIRFDGSSGVTGDADGSIINCQGESIAAGEISEIILTVVDNTLLCTSDGETAAMIVESDGVLIEQVAVLWGVDTDNDNSVDEYIPAVIGDTMDESLLAMRVLMLFSSRDEVAISSNKYTFNSVEYDAPDSRLRREMTTTVQLKN